MNAGECRTARSAAALSGMALLSPAAGILAEMALAWRFGTRTEVDAYRIGAVFLVMGQILLVTQILPHIVVPVFTDCRARMGEAEAWRVSMALGNVFLAAAGVFGFAVFLWPRPVVWLFAAGLEGAARAEATTFIRWFALAYMPLVVCGTATGVLSVYRIFWLPALAQTVRNAVLTAAILFASGAHAVRALVGGSLAAALFAAALYVARAAPLAARAGAGGFAHFDLGHPDVRRGLRLAVPLLGAFAAGQWAPIIINREISRLPPGSLATFGYAYKLGLLISLAPLALATVLFPRFAEEHTSGRARDLAALGTRGLRMGVFLAVPLAACAVLLRGPLVALVFERGAFSSRASSDVAALLGWLVLGAPAAVISVHAEKMFYAQQRAWLPSAVRFATALALTVLAPFVAARDGATGIAILLTVVAWMSAAALLVPLYRQRGPAGWMRASAFFAQMTALGAATAWAGAALGHRLIQVVDRPWFSSTLVCAVGFAGGIALFFLGSVALGVPEALDCTRYVRWQYLEARR